MHAERVQAVVIAKARLHLGHHPVTHRPGHQPDQQRCAGQHKPARRRNRHQPGHRAGNRPQHRRLARSHPFQPQPYQRGAACSGLRRHHRHRRPPAGTPGRAGIEAQPAHPQQRRPGDGITKVMRRKIIPPIAQPPAQHQGAHQPGHAGIDLHHRAAGEIGHAQRVQPAQRRPGPMRNRRVDHQRPQRHQQQQRGELHPVGKRAGHHRRGNDGEGHLVEHEHRFRHRHRHRRGGLRPQGKRPGPGHAGQHQPGKIADKARPVTKGQRIANHDPQHRHHRA